jgi:exodeoxyribonuclease VII small subunit
MARSKSAQPSFEQAMEQLEMITDQIESGEMELAESLAQYERGIKLIKRCRTILDTAEKKIAELGSDAKGGLTMEQPAENDQ